jgi:CheY-like chemotaxis protein
MAERLEVVEPAPEPMRVLLIDNDEDIRELVAAVLNDEGYEVTSMATAEHEAVAAEVGRIEPDCILLDGANGVGFGGSWEAAAYLARRSRPVPTVMFTAHTSAVEEARGHATERAMAADFAAFVQKPFAIDTLLEAVETGTGRSQRFDHSLDGERQRTVELVARLRAAGADDIRTGERREWATFVPPGEERIHQIYWWQRKGIYIVGRYDEDARLELIGRYFERDDAINAAMGGPIRESA